MQRQNSHQIKGSFFYSQEQILNSRRELKIVPKAIARRQDFLKELQEEIDQLHAAQDAIFERRVEMGRQKESGKLIDGQEMKNLEQQFAGLENEIKEKIAARNVQQEIEFKLMSREDTLKELLQPIDEMKLAKKMPQEVFDEFCADIEKILANPKCYFGIKYLRQMSIITTPVAQVEIKNDSKKQPDLREKYYQVCGLLDKIHQEEKVSQDREFLKKLHDIRLRTDALTTVAATAYNKVFATTPLQDEQDYRDAYFSLMGLPPTQSMGLLQIFRHNLLPTTSTNVRNLYASCKEVIDVIHQAKNNGSNGDTKFYTHVLRQTRALLKTPEDEGVRNHYGKLRATVKHGQSSFCKKMFGAMCMFFGCVLIAGSITIKVMTGGLSTPLTTGTLVGGIALFGVGAAFFKGGMTKGLQKHFSRATKLASCSQARRELWGHPETNLLHVGLLSRPIEPTDEKQPNQDNSNSLRAPLLKVR